MGDADDTRSFGVQVWAGRRGLGWPLARLIISSTELTVRSSVERWIPTRSVSKDTAGEIFVDARLKITLPVLHWQRLDILRFEDPAAAFSGITLTLPARKQIVEELRDRGYSVTDQRPKRRAGGPR